MLEALQESACRSAIHEAVVEGQRQRYLGPDLNIIVDHGRLLDNGTHPQNGTFRMVDDGQEPFSFQATQVSNSEGAALQVIQRALIFQSTLGIASYSS